MHKSVLIKGKPDKRLVQRLLLKGEISEADLKEYLATLPDVSDNVEEIIVTMEEGTQSGIGEGKCI
ncbi:MAG: hypothetical protein N2572_02560 [Syntrophales bacterium]|nr:hypothetical protein [Syntrophales bacterium]